MFETSLSLPAVFIIPTFIVVYILIRKCPFILLSLFIAQPWILGNISFPLHNLPYIYSTYIILVAAVLNVTFKKNVFKHTVINLIILFIGYIIIQKYFTVNSTHSIGIIRFFLFSSVLPGILIINFINSTADFNKVIVYVTRWLIIFQIVFIITILIGFRAGLDFRSSNIMSVNIQYSNSGLLIVWGIILFNINHSIRKNAVLIAWQILALLVLIISQSRTFILGTMLALALYTISNFKKAGYTIVLIICIMILSVGVIVSKIGSDFRTKLASAYIVKLDQARSEDVDVLSAGRIKMWTGALDEFKENPIFGVGLGNALRRYPAYNGVIPRVHNLYIQILSELGLIGFLIFIIILAKTLQYLHSMRKNKGLASECLKWGLVLFLFSNLFRADWGLTFLIMLLIERLYFIERYENTHDSRIHYCSNIQ